MAKEVLTSEAQILSKIQELLPEQRQSMFSAYVALSSKYEIDKDLFPFVYLDWYHKEVVSTDLVLQHKHLGL